MISFLFLTGVAAKKTKQTQGVNEIASTHFKELKITFSSMSFEYRMDEKLSQKIYGFYLVIQKNALYNKFIFQIANGLREIIVNFGVVLPTFGMNTDRDTVLEIALAAMELGYDSIWCSDHLALPQSDADPFGVIFEPLSTLAYLAGITRGIKLGISSLVLPQRNPVEVAKQLAAIDLLSEGRTILAAGIGWSEGEYNNLGYDYHNRAERMDEALRVLKLLWGSRTPVSFHGKFYHFDELVFSPLPQQFGGPKVWIAGNSEAALRRAARLGDGWHPNLPAPQELIKLLSKVCHLLGERDFTVCQRLRLTFGEGQPPKAGLHGNPEQILRQLRAFQGAGMDDCILYFTNESLAGRIDDMHLFITQIAPELE